MIPVIPCEHCGTTFDWRKAVRLEMRAVEDPYQQHEHQACTMAFVLCSLECCRALISDQIDDPRGATVLRLAPKPRKDPAP